MSSNFGEYVKELREREGLSLNQLAEKSGVSNAQISRIENGLRELPRPETIRKLAKGLNAPQTELMEKAGYFEGLDDQKKSGVKNYLQLQENFDDTLYQLIEHAYGLRQKKEVLKAIETFFSEDIAEYLKDRKRDKLPASYKGIKDFLEYCDMSLETKEKFIQFLKNSLGEFIIKESPVSYSAEKELFEKSLELSDKQIKEQYEFKVDGRELTEEEYQRMIAAVRAERLYQDQKDEK